MSKSGRTYIPKPKDGAVWLTGASSGIGRATALRLARDGWTVYATARSEDKLMSLAAQSNGRIFAKPGDVTDADRMAQIVAEIEGAEGLALAIFNAGVYIPMPAGEFDAADAKKHFDVNLTGVTNGLAPAMRGMVERGTGCLALVASVAGYRGLPKAGAYGPTKAALINMVEALAFELHPAGVRICAICPGFVDTEATAVNDFEMPFLMQPEEAANRLVDGLQTTKIKIAFPRRFDLILKSMRLLPTRAYLWLAGKAMGYGKDGKNTG